MLTDVVSKVKNAVICDLISWSPIGSSQRAEFPSTGGSYRERAVELAVVDAAAHRALFAARRHLLERGADLVVEVRLGPGRRLRAAQVARQQPVATSGHVTRYDTIRDAILTCARKPT